MRKIIMLCALLVMAAAVTAAEEEIRMILVEGGKFSMGSKGGDEKPIHEITLNNFKIGKYEVLQGEFEKIMGYNPSMFKGEKNPVEQVSWFDAVLFCNELSKKEGIEEYYEIKSIERNENKNIISGIVTVRGGKGYRLPTEAEWEFAAKGGNKSKGFKYSGSNNIDEVSWYRKNSDSKTHGAGEKIPNELGLFDMSGNVLEYCYDWYGRNYYGVSVETNPVGPETGTEKVERGGSWSDEGTASRVSYRGYGYPLNIYSVIGFRVVKSE